MHAIHSERELRHLDDLARAGRWRELLVAVDVLVQERISRALEADQEEVFSDLVEGKALSRIVARAGRLGFDLARPHTPVVCRATRAVVQAAKDQSMAAIGDTLLESYAAAAPPGGPRPLLGGLGPRELLAYLPTGDAEVAARVGGATLRRAATMGRPVTVGIGPACTAPGDYAANAERARWTAEILQLGEISRPMAGFDEMGVYALLFKVDRAEELEQFMRRWIGALIDYDEKRHADLTLTLGALLEGRGLRHAAEQLVIHVSTLKYRIKRIHEILALDYHDPEIAFNLALAVRLYRISRRGWPAGAADPGVGGCPPDKGGVSRQRRTMP